MKKLILIIFLFLFLNQYSSAQSEIVGITNSAHIGSDYELYLNTTFTLDSTFKKGNFTNVFKSKDHALSGSTYNCLNKEELVGHNFKVLEISEKDYQYKIFKLIDESGEVYFLLYDQNYSDRFPFTVSKIDYEKHDLCKEIEIKIDDFTKQKTYMTPFKRNRGYDIFVHVDENMPPRYYLFLEVYGSTLNVAKKEVKLLLEDGTVWEKEAEDFIDPEPDGSGYNYTALVKLNSAEAVLITRNKLKKFRLFVYDRSISTHDSEMLKLYMNCILDKTFNKY